MEKDLKHIDLIDKYLSNALSKKEMLLFEQFLSDDPDFKKEQEIYRKLYKGIEDKAAVDLKKRLDLYHEAYKNEQKSKPKGLYRRLIIVGGSIAAIVVFGTLLVTNNTFQKENPVTEKSVPLHKEKIDSLKQQPVIDNVEEEKVVEETTKDPVLLPDGLKDDSQLSVTVDKKILASELIRSVGYPINIQYTFDGDTLTLFGDASIPSLELRHIIKKNDTEYYLKYREAYYSIEKTTSKRKLKSISKNYSKSQEPSQEKITISIKGIDEVSKVSEDLKVYYTSNKSQYQYYFSEEKNGEKLLFLTGNIDPENTKVYILKETTKSDYFLRINNKLYLLKPGTSRLTPLEELSVFANKKTKLFREGRKLLSRPVYLIE